jgi:hypothetical protein
MAYKDFDKGIGDQFVSHIYLTLAVMVVMMLIFLRIGSKIYDKFIGPRLRRRDWNEFSYFRGLQAVLMSILVMWAIPIVVLAIIGRLFHK